MKILYISSMFWPDIGGMETLAMNSLPLFQERGHHILFLTSTSSLAPDPVGNYKGIEIRRFPMVESFRDKNILNLIKIKRDVAKLKKEFLPDLIHLNFGGLPVEFFHHETRSACNAPSLLTLHSSVEELDIREDSLLGKILNDSHHITTVSDSMKEDLLSKHPEFGSKTSRIYNGVPDLFKPSASAKPCHRDFLCIGRIVHEKGFDVAILALEKVLSEFPDATLTITGVGSGLQTLKALSEKLNVGGSITFTGRVEHEEVFDLIDDHAAMLVPSRWRESFGLVSVEAALMEKPVIATNIAGLSETVIDGVTGLHFQNENVDDLANQMLRILRDPTLGKTLGKQGRIRALSMFSLTQYVDDYERLYDKIIETNS